MDFIPIIEELQGRAAALNSTIETLKILQAGDAALKYDAEVSAMPPILSVNPSSNGKKPARKAKVQRLAKKVKSSGGGTKRAAILEYLRNHPGSGAVEIAKALGLNRGAVNYNLTNAKRAGLIKVEGSTLYAKWSLAKQTPDTKTPPHTSEEDSELDLECKYCNEQCASSERLQRHMRVVHGKTT